MRSILLQKIGIYFHTADLLTSVTALQIWVALSPPFLLDYAPISY